MGSGRSLHSSNGVCVVSTRSSAKNGSIIENLADRFPEATEQKDACLRPGFFEIRLLSISMSQRLSKFLRLHHLEASALLILALFAVLTVIYFARALLIPITLALLFSLLLKPVVKLLQKQFRIQPPLGSALTMSSALLLIGLFGWLSIPPATSWIQTIPARMPEIKYRLRLLLDPIKKFTEASERMQELTESEELVVEVEKGGFTSLLMNQTPTMLASIMVTIVLIYFMLASGDRFLRKTVRLFASFNEKRRAVSISRDVERRVSLYLQAITLVNIGLGIAVGIAAYFVGLENPILWGVVACFLNYIPYLGAFIGVVATFLVGLLTFASTPYALVMPSIYLLFNVIEGNFITPTIVGRTLTLNPVIVFLSLMFWGWMWGIIGVLLAVPILAAFKIICDHIPSLESVGAFVGNEDEEDASEPTVETPETARE